MVVFEDGLAKKADYRHFIVRGPDGEGAADDTAAMDEVLRRRLARLLAGAAGDDVGTAEDEDRGDRAKAAGEAEEPDETENARGAERVPEAEITFEREQISKACDAAAEMGGAKDAAKTGSAKNAAEEEVWIPGEDFPVVLPRRSPSLRLLQQLRDESHRFAITFHRKKRTKAMTRSALDAVPGLGAAKQKALLGSLGSLAKIKAASQEELLKVPGIGPALARAIAEHFAEAS